MMDIEEEIGGIEGMTADTKGTSESSTSIWKELWTSAQQRVRRVMNSGHLICTI
jgi:hypothetical protein